MARIYPLEYVCAGRGMLSSGRSGGGVVLWQAAAVVLLCDQHPADYHIGICDRMPGQPASGLGRVGLCHTAAQSDGAGLHRLQRTVVFAERSGQRLVFGDAARSAKEDDVC